MVLGEAECQQRVQKMLEVHWSRFYMRQELPMSNCNKQSVGNQLGCGVNPEIPEAKSADNKYKLEDSAY
jgi:hypothetical protein